jgi:hypothetical protein
MEDLRVTNGVFGNRILKNEYDSDFAFLKNKSYFIQLFLNKLYFIELFLKSQISKFVHQIRIEF